ncbi:MAG TPA: LemA family protein [Candidatus Nanoarchaeia archaeon]|nr:LemA family protein [Candidatus Nanoarchaeia archaeon]
MVSGTTIGIIIGVVILLAVIYIYNSLIKLKVRVSNAWSQIDVQLKRRYELIPNLVNAVKGYMKHEKGVLEQVTKARTSLLSGSMQAKAKASNQITEALKSIFAVAENYPQLKASENFKQLQEELSGTESKIAYARQFYNDMVMQLNQAIQSFPTNFFAKLFKVQQRDFFAVEEKERKSVKVEF